MSRVIRITESQLRSFIMESLGELSEKKERIVKKAYKDKSGRWNYERIEGVSDDELDARTDSDDEKRFEREERKEEIEKKSLKDRLKDPDEVSKAKRRVAISKALRNQKELNFGD